MSWWTDAIDSGDVDALAELISSVRVGDVVLAVGAPVDTRGDEPLAPAAAATPAGGTSPTSPLRPVNEGSNEPTTLEA